MSGFFGCVSKRDCVADVFYGTDYHSHLGTKRGGMAFYDGKDFVRTIHSLENAYFRNKFEDDLPRFEGSSRSLSRSPRIWAAFRWWPSGVSTISKS